MKKKILFLIHDLGVGGAEKVLVDLVNRLNPDLFDITVIALFGGGVNERFLASHIHYQTVWKRTIPGNSRLMKALTPAQLHRICVKDHYDIEVSYLEGPSARIISGCGDRRTKLFCWIHVEQESRKKAAGSFRSYEESVKCYQRFDRIVCVSEGVREDFRNLYPDIQNLNVRYNTVEAEKILSLKNEPVEDGLFAPNELKLAAVGKISKRKGIDRLARMVERLRNDGLPVHLYALGEGPDQKEIESWIADHRLTDSFTFLGYQTNPYRYMGRCDLLVCASLAEGFSTAVTEALILGLPVCTVDVSGMRELLGDDNEYGIVTPNQDDALFEAVRTLLRSEELRVHYSHQAQIRGTMFSAKKTVRAVEDLLTGETG